MPVFRDRCCDWKYTASFSWQAGHRLFVRGSCCDFATISSCIHHSFPHSNPTVETEFEVGKDQSIVSSTYRWIRSYILGNTSRVVRSDIEIVMIDARRGGRRSGTACPAAEIQSVVCVIRDGIEDIGAIRRRRGKELIVLQWLEADKARVYSPVGTEEELNSLLRLLRVVFCWRIIHSGKRRDEMRRDEMMNAENRKKSMGRIDSDAKDSLSCIVIVKDEETDPSQQTRGFLGNF